MNKTRSRILRLILIIITFIVVPNAQTQILDPTHWHVSVKQISNTKYEIRWTVLIDKPWHIYSQSANSILAFPTVINFIKNPLIEIVDKPKEYGVLKTIIQDKIELKVYETHVDFVQDVELKKKVKTKVSGNIDYMSCTNIQCLPPRKFTFSISVNP